jgi:O-antigen/teichoic acid export membrane protein
VYALSTALFTVLLPLSQLTQSTLPSATFSLGTATSTIITSTFTNADFLTSGIFLDTQIQQVGVLGCAWLCLAVLGCAWLCLNMLGTPRR